MWEAEFDRLLLELDAETVKHRAADEVAERFEVGSAGACAGDERKAVAGGDADRTEAEALAKPGALQQPGGWELDAVGADGPVGYGVGGKPESLCDSSKNFVGNDGILEKRAGAAAIRIAMRKDHTLGPADVTHGLGDLPWGGRDVRAEVPKQIGVRQVRTSMEVETESHGGDEIAAGLDGVEEAAPIAELAGFAGKLDETVCLEIQGADGVDGLGDLLPVGANVLDGGTADKAGDAGEALDAGKVLLTRLINKCLPGKAGGGAKLAGGGVDLRRLGRAVDRNVDDEAGKPGVGNEEIAAAAKREQWKGALAGEADGFEELRFRAGAGEEACRTAELKRRQRGQQDVLAHGKGLAWLHSAVIPKLRSGWRRRGQAPTITNTDRFWAPRRLHVPRDYGDSDA